MKKYYVIRLAYDDGFWSEEKQDFVGWLNATKYNLLSAVEHHVVKAASKKPVTIVEIYENE